jgi:hypothetical protein
MNDALAFLSGGPAQLVPVTDDGSAASGPRLTPERAARLRKFNLAVAAVHLVTAVLIFALTDRGAKAPVYTFYANEHRREQNGQMYAPAVLHLGGAMVGYFSGGFLLMACADHLLVATWWRAPYERLLQCSQNPFRWAEYSVSASLMTVMIALLSGVMSLHLLLALFGLTMTTMTFGALQELATWRLQGRPDQKTLLPFWLGCVPHVFKWSILASFFFHGLAVADPPEWIWGIIFVQFFTDSTFAVNMWLQQKERGRWKDYVYGEFAYCVLSLVAKQFLAWFNYGGTRTLS